MVRGSSCTFPVGTGGLARALGYELKTLEQCRWEKTHEKEFLNEFQAVNELLARHLHFSLEDGVMGARPFQEEACVPCARSTAR